MGLRVLLTNNTLDIRAGSELYVRDVALGLLARGHQPVAYSPVLGAVAAELRRATVPVIDSLDGLGSAPDVVHGHHHLETMEAALRFPRTPVLSFCHGWLPWQEAPALLPNVVRYVAVDLACRSRLIDEHGIDPAKVALLYNFVDLRRFRPRGPLPARPARALVFGNSAGEHSHLEPVREACARRGIAVDAAGASSTVLERPEEALPGYDLVFAKARCAMEAMATGCAVVLCDLAGAGPMVTSASFEGLRELNFGIRTLTGPLTAAAIGAEIDRYDPQDAGRVSELMRSRGDLEGRLDELLALYREARLLMPRETGLEETARAAAAYLKMISPRVKGSETAEQRRLRAEAQLAACRREVAGLVGRAREAEEQLAARSGDIERLNREPGIRLQTAALRVPLLGGLLRSFGRRFLGPPRSPGT